MNRRTLACLFFVISLSASFGQGELSEAGYTDRQNFFRMTAPELPDWLESASWNAALLQHPVGKTNNVDLLIKSLGSDSFKEREKASKELLSLGRAVAPKLRAEAQANRDPEISMRAEDLLKKIKENPADRVASEADLELFAELEREIRTGEASGKTKAQKEIDALFGTGLVPAPALPEDPLTDALVPNLFAMRCLLPPKRILDLLASMEGPRAKEAHNWLLLLANHYGAPVAQAMKSGRLNVMQSLELNEDQRAMLRRGVGSEDPYFRQFCQKWMLVDNSRGELRGAHLNKALRAEDPLFANFAAVLAMHLDEGRLRDYALEEMKQSREDRVLRGIACYHLYLYGRPDVIRVRPPDGPNLHKFEPLIYLMDQGETDKIQLAAAIGLIPTTVISGRRLWKVDDRLLHRYASLGFLNEIIETLEGTSVKLPGGKTSWPKDMVEVLGETGPGGEVLASALTTYKRLFRKGRECSRYHMVTAHPFRYVREVPRPRSHPGRRPLPIEGLEEWVDLQASQNLSDLLPSLQYLHHLALPEVVYGTLYHQALSVNQPWEQALGGAPGPRYWSDKLLRAGLESPSLVRRLKVASVLAKGENPAGADTMVAAMKNEKLSWRARRDASLGLCRLEHKESRADRVRLWRDAVEASIADDGNGNEKVADRYTLTVLLLALRDTRDDEVKKFLRQRMITGRCPRAVHETDQTCFHCIDRYAVAELLYQWDMREVRSGEGVDPERNSIFSVVQFIFDDNETHLPNFYPPGMQLVDGKSLSLGPPFLERVNRLTGTTFADDDPKVYWKYKDWLKTDSAKPFLHTPK